MLSPKSSAQVSMQAELEALRTMVRRGDIDMVDAEAMAGRIRDKYEHQDKVSPPLVDDEAEATGVVAAADHRPRHGVWSG